MKTLAIYFYDDDNAVHIYFDKDAGITVKNKFGEDPYDPITESYRSSYFNDPTGENIPSYEEIGLYYRYDMTSLGWNS